MKKFSNLVLVALVSVLPLSSCVANATQSEGQLILSYSDGRAESKGIAQVNRVLRRVGVRVSTVNIPEEARPILEVSKKRAINEQESMQLLSLFSLHRGELLNEIKQAGRQPEMHRGGFLSTSEIGVAPYPKVYDMKAMSSEVKFYLQEKFGKLHVNSAENGVGIDEVMTIVSGGPWTWFFLLPDNVIGKLTLGQVSNHSNAWRISYPGLVPHGGFLDSEYGLVVAYAHGPKNFVMRYEDPSVMGAELLGTNAWIDFTSESPQLLD
ncbi:hypothetical protein [Pseudoalteromonas piscicida]|uniref:hypothetical protein n=1 Tax=Pseudoalteromonas piscicida TaxID=43662 RepID=UPI001C98BA0C|nr:hypothetical protein [Pseudoalteromonas piscicida]QZO14904.1 hypothetical protein K5642_21745 [Pseudoalteromonas piscicida]